MRRGLISASSASQSGACSVELFQQLLFRYGFRHRSLHLVLPQSANVSVVHFANLLSELFLCQRFMVQGGLPNQVGTPLCFLRFMPQAFGHQFISLLLRLLRELLQ